VNHANTSNTANAFSMQQHAYAAQNFSSAQRPREREVEFLRPGPSRSLTDDVSHRNRGTAGGNRLPSSCPPSTDVVSLTAVNIALNSVVSDDAVFGTTDLTDFYLGTPVTLSLSQRQSIRIDVDSYSPAALARFSLLPFIRTARNGKR
jgi:hypothetical protein